MGKSSTQKPTQAKTTQPVFLPPKHDIFEYVNVKHERAALQPPMLEPASAGVETHDALVKALENCGGQITSITINDCVSKQGIPAKEFTALTRAKPKKTQRRRPDLLAAPPHKPISPLAIHAVKTSSPTRPPPSADT